MPRFSMLVGAFILISTQLYAQDVFPTVAPAVAAYLKLTPDQLAAVEVLRQASNREARQLAQAKIEVVTKLDEERRKDVPDPALLGKYYAENIRLTRTGNDAIARLVADQRRLLTIEQNALLAPLQEVQRLSALTTQTECEGFLETPASVITNMPDILLAGDFARLLPCSRPGPILSSTNVNTNAEKENPGIVPASPLTLYLELTPDQVLAINALQQPSSRIQAQKTTRAAEVQVELMRESAKSELDSLAMGLRLVEIETIRREIAEEQSSLASAIQAKLSAAQKARLQALESSRALVALDGIAQAEGFLTPAQPSGPIPIVGGVVKSTLAK
jgi:hypothetical protein